MSNYLSRLRAQIGNDLLLLPSAAVIILNTRNEVLLGLHADRTLWVLPGGLVEPGETPADAAVREAFEETGLTVELDNVMGVFGGPDLRIQYRNGDVATYIATIFRGHTVKGDPQADGVEILELRYFSKRELETTPHPRWMDNVMPLIFSETEPTYFQRPDWRPDETE